MAKKDRKPRSEPFKIDEKAIERLFKRIDTVQEERTQIAVRGHMKAPGLEALGLAHNEAETALTKVEMYLSDVLTEPPEPSDE